MKTKMLLVFLTAILLLGTVALPVTAETATPSYISVAQPITRIIGDIAIVRDIQSAKELEDVKAMSDKPAAAILHIDADMNVLGNAGETLTTVSRFLSDTSYSILPALYVKDQATADALVAYLNVIGFYDVFLMSSDPALVKSMRRALPAAMGVIDYTVTYGGVASPLSKEQCIEIRRSLMSNNGTIAYLPLQACGKEQVQYLYDRRVNVWVATSEAPDVAEQTKALLSGAYGVVSDEAASLLDIACNKLDHRSLTRIPSLVGHRGSNLAPENTLEGALLTYEKGADAIELDVYLTADGEVVVMHDATTGRTCNADLPVEASTLAQLKELYVNKGYENHKDFSGCRIPTLGEFFEAFRDTDCILVVEIKSQNTAIVPIVCDLIDQYDIYANCNIISFHYDILSAFREEDPAIPVGYLCGNVLSNTDRNADFRVVATMVGGINASYNPHQAGLDKSDVHATTYRGYGIYAWTFLDGYTDLIKNGYTGLTADDVYNAGKYIMAVETAAMPESVASVGDTLSLELIKKHFDRNQDEDADATKIQYLVLSGEDCVEIVDGTVSFNKSGTVTLVPYYPQKAGMVNYHLYTDPITVTVSKDVDILVPVLCLGIGLAVSLSTALGFVLRKKKKAAR